MKILTTVVLLSAAAAFASVGKVAVLDGGATRTPDGGKDKVALKVGDPVELKDTIEVAKGGNMKLELSDGSQLGVAGGSKLEISEADFSNLDQRSFVGTLSIGKIWAKVKKAVGGGKFEVKTERAVAGVRGTIFRIDADIVAKASQKKPTTTVMIHKGTVAVEAQHVKVAQANVPAPGAPGDKPARKQVAGPHEISKDQWEETVQQMMEAGSMVTIDGNDIWEAAQLQKHKADGFDNWAKKNIGDTE